MDDPWANAWDESQTRNSRSSATTKSLFSNSTWKNPAEDETDIALPSWSAGPAVDWNEPSDDVPALWGASAPNNTTDSTTIPTFSPKVTGWTSSYASISALFGGSSVDGNSEAGAEEEEEEGATEDEEVALQDGIPGDEESGTAATKDENLKVADPWTHRSTKFLDSDLNATASNSPPTPASPDAFEFGTFESGVSDSIAGPSVEEKSWNSDNLPNSDSEWDSAWASKEIDPKSGEEEVLDEWERARREKEKMDRVVPPEFLASILRTLEEISDDLWTPDSQLKPNDSNKVATANPSLEHPKNSSDFSPLGEDAQHSGSAGNDVVDKESTRKDGTETTDPFLHWKSGIDIIESLSEICQTIAPPLPPLSSLPPLPSQSNNLQSPIIKRSSEAIRLTRSTLISSSGPFGMYLQTKGSIEWEVAVKSRLEKTSEQEREEIVPAGWKILPKEKEDEKKVEAPEMKKKGSSILSSFFGRKTETPPTESKGTKDASPRPSFASSRNSVDSAAGKSDTKTESSSTKLPTSPVSAPAPSTSSTLSTFTSSNIPSTYGDGGSPDLFQDAPTTAPAPSAVSRFLNRFSSSRNRPSHSRQNSNTSLALSTDDLEFLQDIVPSASDFDHDHDNELVQTGSNELAGLQKMINSAPLPAPLLPPPRAPQAQSPRNPSDDFIPERSGPSDASRQKNNLDFVSSSNPILTPSPALPSQIQTSITQSLQKSQSSRSSTPSFASRSSSPGLDMLAFASSSASGGKSSQLTGSGINALGMTAGNAISRPSSSVSLNTRTSSTTTMKRPTPVAIMSSFSGSSSKPSGSVNSFSFLPPPPSIRGSGKSTPTPSLIDDGPPRVPSLTSAAPSDGLDDDDFSDFLSATTTDAVQPPFSASNLISLSSAQPLFSAGSGAFNDLDSSVPSDAPLGQYNDPLNTSVSSIASAHSTSNTLGSELDSFGEFPDPFDDFSSSPALRDTLRTPSPPALPAKSPGKIAARRAFGMEPSSSGVARRASAGKKTMRGSGVGGRIPPGRLNLPPPVSSSAYSRNWSATAPEPTPAISSGNTVNSASPFVASSSAPTLAPPSSPSPKIHQKRVSKEAHQRTRSLVEDAIARSAIWPSPAPSAVSSTGGYGSESGYGAYGFGTAPPLSPLPPILSPPPESSASRKRKDDLLGGHDDDDDDVPLASLASGSTYGSVSNSTAGSFNRSTTTTQQTVENSAIPSKSSTTSAPSSYGTNGSGLNRNGTLPPLPLPSPTSSSKQPTLLEFGTFGSESGLGVRLTSSSKPSETASGHSTVSPPPMSVFDLTSASATSKKTTGGLSAQDLSFFEGL